VTLPTRISELSWPAEHADCASRSLGPCTFVAESTAAHRDIGGHRPGHPLSASLTIRCPLNKVTSWPLTPAAAEAEDGIRGGFGSCYTASDPPALSQQANRTTSAPPVARRRCSPSVMAR
jgi:hypothetical protein